VGEGWKYVERISTSYMTGMCHIDVFDLQLPGGKYQERYRVKC